MVYFTGERNNKTQNMWLLCFCLKVIDSTDKINDVSFFLCELFIANTLQNFFIKRLLKKKLTTIFFIYVTRKSQ